MSCNIGVSEANVFFSIVIASYNVKHELMRCVDSINSQIFTNYELLISDGGSVDGTVEFIESRGIRNLAWYKSSRDEGIYDALNIALSQASGRWILVLGADDRLINTYSLLDAHNQIDGLALKFGIVYSDLYIAGRRRTVWKRYPQFDEFERKYKGGAPIHHQTAFLARESLLRTHAFSLKYKIHSDYDLILRIIKMSGAVKIDGAYVGFNSNGYSSKLRNICRSFREMCGIRRSHGYYPFPLRLLATYCMLLARKIFNI